VYGTVIRQAREHRGLTQSQLARISGVEQPNISAIENGRRAPESETFHRLLLGCGFELVAAAGQRVLPVLPPDDAELVADVPAPADLPMETRVRILTAALDAAEAIVRSR
jgi:transcriptional regulator with XRE-family HTH domain